MCTTIIVGKNATKDGSVIIAHSDDDVDDGRVIRVPSFNRSKRNVYYDNASLGLNLKYNSTEIRRYIGTDRGEAYNTVSEGHPVSTPLGSIPGFGKDTYAYFDSSYGIANEKGLLIGECTCGAKISPGPEPGKRIFYSAELSRVALERCTGAREAVELIGSLILNYGYYGTGETLLLGDAEEGWVMEMCAHEENGSAGIWVARRVPDDDFFVAANQFRIRDIRENHDLRALQEILEHGAETAVNRLISEKNTAGLSEFSHDHCKKVIAEWWKQATSLIVKYNDGCTTTGPVSIMNRVDYPNQWLHKTDYFQGPTEY